MTINELAKIMKDNGISGAGGAGFPAYAKLNEKADTVLLNCAECEPLLKVHRQVLKFHAFEILKALHLIAQTVGAKNCIVAMKESYKTTLATVKAELEAFPNIKIGILPEVYPAGDEVVLIYETTGKVVPPASIPISVGCIVYNVETVYNVYKAVFEQRSVTHKYVTVTGEVKNPVTVKAPLGITFKELIARAGGATVPSYALLCGGPMTGPVAKDTDVVTKTTNAVIVLPENHPVIIRKETKLSISEKRAMSACCQCRSCTDLCSRHLLGHPIEPHKIMRAMSSGKVTDASAIINAAYCSGCGLCEMYACPQSLHPKTIILALKGALRQNGITPPKLENIDPVSPDRAYRKVPKHRLTARLGLTQYNIPAPLSETEVDTDKVKILFSQHVGAPAVPIIKEGDEVSVGQVIALPKENALSNTVHASVSGKVLSVTDKSAVILKKKEA